MVLFYIYKNCERCNATDLKPITTQESLDLWAKNKLAFNTSKIILIGIA